MKNKKIVTLLVVLTLIFSNVLSSVTHAINVYDTGIRITLNGSEVYFDQAPIIQDDTTYVPLRAIFEAMGFDVYWSELNQNTVVTTKYGQMTILYPTALTSGGIYYDTVNGRKEINTKPIIVNDRTLIPVRAVAEATGYDVNWDGNNKTVIITSVQIPAYYPNTSIPEYEACIGKSLPYDEKTGCYYGLTSPDEVKEYVLKYLLISDFALDERKTDLANEIWTSQMGYSDDRPTIAVYKNNNTGDFLQLVDYGQGFRTDVLFIKVNEIVK